MVSSPSEIGNHGETNPQNTSDTTVESEAISDTIAADSLTTRGVGRSMAGEMFNPAVDLRVHDAGTTSGGETWDRTRGLTKRQNKNTCWGNIQVPQSLKQSKRELDQPRLPSASKGKFWGLVWEATCIPGFP